MDEIDYLGRDSCEVNGFRRIDTEEDWEWNNQLRMESMDYWRLCDELSVLQAALLVIGEDPSKENVYAENWQLHERPIGYEAAKTAIMNALRRGKIEGKIVPYYDTDINNNVCGEIPNTLDIEKSRVDVESLRMWLRNRGIQTGFFFPTANDAPDYLDPSNPRYAPKLAAAVRAWQAVTDPGKRSPRQALEKWLREHAVEFGLTDEDGNPVKQAVGECSKVANWQPGGGAPKTPSG
jgi:hypothetical protein